MKQSRVFPFLRESIRVEDTDAEDTKDEVNDKYENVQRKKSEEELEGEEIEKELEHDKREEESECET